MSIQEREAERRAVVCTTGEESPHDDDARLARSWLRVGIAAVFAGQGMVFSLAVNMTPPPYGSTPYWVLHGGLMFSAAVVLTVLGGPLLRSTAAMARARRLSIEGLFTLSLAGAFIGSVVSSLTGEGDVFYEVVAVVIAIYTIGRMVSERSQARARLQSERLRERFEMATVLGEGGATHRMPVSELVAGCRVQAAPGEPLTVDGEVISGSGYVRETPLTGEPMPVVRHPGDSVRAGSYSEDGLFVVEARALEGEREIDGILRMVEDPGGRPSELQTQADRLIQGFLPLVAGVSVATAIWWGFIGTWVDAVLNSMAVLLVACPCALGLATPVAVWQGLYRMARLGLVSRDGALIDALARTRHVFFDKTGTLSEADMRVVESVACEESPVSPKQLWAVVRAVEEHAGHPVGRSIAASLEASNEAVGVRDFEVVPGQGVRAQVRLSDGEELELEVGEATLGNDTDGSRKAAEAALCERSGKRIYVFVNGRCAGVLVLAENPREGLGSVWERLEAMAVRATVLTGDPRPALEVPEGVEILTGQSATAKAARVRASADLEEMPLLVGDGLNDAGAMASAAGAVAMGGGEPLTRSVAGGQLVSDRLAAIPEAIELARKIHRRLHGNLIYAAAYNVLGMTLAAVGWLHPVLAAVIMLVSSAWVTARALKASD